MENPKSSTAWIWASILALCVLAAYGNSFNGDFIFDDMSNIVNNDALHRLSEPGKVFFSAGNVSRPLVSLTLAIDYALFGNIPRGYHFFNLGAHVLAALLLFGIVRRTLLSERLRERFGAASGALAFCAALIWAVHPLNTEAVTYIIQRAESMMGMFFLLALYCAIRGTEPQSKPAWHAAAIAAAAFGAGCKQVIVVVPVTVLLYDRCFISRSFAAALRRAPGLYAGLLATWPIVFVLLAMEPKVGSAGFGMKNFAWYEYAWSQFVVILHYVKLAFWPLSLCFDYDWHVERNWGRVIPSAVIVLGLFGLTVRNVVRNTAAGFCGAWFFLILAPTSSIMPVGDLATERRMYLPLAAIAVLVVIGGHALCEKLFGKITSAWGMAVRVLVAVIFFIATALGVLTARRNALYQSELSMWEDVVAKRPENRRALLAVARDRLQRNDLAGARQIIDKAVEVDAKSKAKFYEVSRMKGRLLMAERDYPHAAEAFQEAVASYGESAISWYELHTALIALKKPAEALAALERAAKLAPDNAQWNFEYGNALLQTGRLDDAITVYQRAAKLAPDSAPAHSNLGAALAQAGRVPEALVEFDAVLMLEPKDESALFNRGYALELMRRPGEALASYRAAVKANPKRADAANAAAWILATSADDGLRNGKEAVVLAVKACELTQNQNPLMLDTLAAAYAEAGQFEKAVPAAESALNAAALGSALSKEFQGHLELFKAGKAFHQK